MVAKKTTKATSEGARKGAKDAATGGPAVGATPPSKWFQEFVSKAETIAADNERLYRLLDDVAMTRAKHRTASLRRVRPELEALTGAVRTHLDGDATVPRDALVTSVAGLLYLVDPTDFVPDWTPKVGTEDDAAVVGMAYAACEADLARFRPAPRGIGRFLRRGGPPKA